MSIPNVINAQVIPAAPTAPADLTVQNPRDDISLLPYQVDGVRFMLAREAVDAPICRGGILGDDMGLGKTFQCISLIKSSPLTTARNLIVCPPALVAGWTEELQACGFSVYHLRAGKADWFLQKAGGDSTGRPVWITTYPKVTIYKRTLCSQEPFDRVILDEGHCIRNGPSTERWRACVALTKKTTVRWILSATPVQNGGTDWRNLCWWLRVKCKDAVIRSVAPVIMLRRTMAELRGVLASLPPVASWKVHDLHITDPEEAAIFQALANQLEEAMESRHVSTLMKLELYMRIQQFVVHPQVYIESMRRKFGSAYPRPDWSSGTTKWTACFAELASCVRRAVPTIIFCQFRVEMDMAAVAAAAMGAKVWSIRGGMTSGAVGAAVKEARETVAANAGLAAEDQVPVVLIIQIVAGGAGLNLQFCQCILFLSQHWNPAVVHQAVGRAVRIGQSAVVQIHVFRVVDSVMDNIDLRMADLHGVKVAGAQSICGTFFQGFAPFLPLKEQAIQPVLPGVLPSTQDPTVDTDKDEDPTAVAAA
jgi:SNF2 family DNA or RNA helicase